MNKRTLLASVCALSIAGCASHLGPRPILNAHGALPAAPQGNPGAPANLEENFRAAALAAFPQSSGAATPPVTADAIDEFQRSGFALVYARCNDYFWVMGRNQTRARVGRDAVAPVITLLGGIIALRDFSSNPGREQDLLQILNLGSSLATSGLDIYDTHFLFGAENINSVRALTFGALAAHRTGVDELPVTTAEQAAIHLIDHQTICTPPNILELARDAIASGEIEQTISGGGVGRRDLDWRRSLAQALGLSDPLTAQQAFALWWLLENAPTGSAEDKTAELLAIRELLVALAADLNPFEPSTDPAAAPVLKTTWLAEARIAQLLDSIPPATLASYTRELTARRTPDAPAAEGGGMVAGTQRSLIPSETVSGFQRVRVRVAR